jgi:non-reducing end alpha-L-arabinofuranosidase
MVSSGGSPGTGGSPGSGGSVGSGGAKGNGGASSSGGATGSGGASGTGGRTGSGGAVGSGGATASGGASGTGGATALGGATGTAGSTGAAGPCDIYGSANTPCVAAHSTVRALYGSYSGNLYQVRRASDKTTKEIAVLAPGGVANSATQDLFCSGACTISEIYDQSPNGNHLTKAPAGGWLNNGGLEADATKAKIKLNGNTVYGVYTTSNFDNDVGAVGYRNNTAKGLATGDQPESMYMVASGKHYNQWCCFDYGNAETNNLDNGKATMETVYFGNSTQWGKGSGTGPWVMADLEDGVYAGGSTAAAPTNTSLIADYVTAMLKGPSGNRFVLKGGDAQSGSLVTKYDGARPAGYSPQKKEGAIILGIGGDNSHTGEGTFFEGCITSGNPTDAADDAVQANIVAAGYGR